MQAQEHRGLFPGARDRAVTSSRNRRLGHSRNSATSPPRRLLHRSWPRGDSNPALPPPSASSPQASKAGLSSAPGPSERVMQEAASGFECGSPRKANPRLLAYQALGPGQAPKLQPGPQAFPLPIMALDSYRQPTHPVSSQHWQLRAGAGAQKEFATVIQPHPDAHPLTRTAWEGRPSHRRMACLSSQD